MIARLIVGLLVVLGLVTACSPKQDEKPISETEQELTDAGFKVISDKPVQGMQEVVRAKTWRRSSDSMVAFTGNAESAGGEYDITHFTIPITVGNEERRFFCFSIDRDNVPKSLKHFQEALDTYRRTKPTPTPIKGSKNLEITLPKPYNTCSLHVKEENE